VSDSNLPILADNLRAARESADLSQVALAQLAGVDLSNLNKLENGHAYPSIVTLVRLARALRTTASELLRGVE
jgi:transcriptional regulator with XRE-family HTH domain